MTDNTYNLPITITSSNPYFGFGKIVIHVSDEKTYTMYMFYFLNNFAFGIKLPGIVTDWIEKCLN
jgi:hypothetical protein